MKRLCFFDTLAIFALVCAFFAVGFHIGKSKDKEVISEAEITLKIYKAKIPSDIKSTELKIDGKYLCSLSSLDDESLSILAYGSYKDAGFLTSGAKYLSKNQPLEIVGDDAYFYGRIVNIHPISDMGG